MVSKDRCIIPAKAVACEKEVMIRMKSAKHFIVAAKTTTRIYSRHKNNYPNI